MMQPAVFQKKIFQARLERVERGGVGTAGQTLVGMDTPKHTRIALRKPKRIRGKTGLMWWAVAFGIGFLALLGARKLGTDVVPWVSELEVITPGIEATILDVVNQPYFELIFAGLIAFGVSAFLNLRGVVALVMMLAGVALTPTREAGYLDSAQAWAENHYSQGYVSALIAQVREPGQTG